MLSESGIRDPEFRFGWVEAAGAFADSGEFSATALGLTIMANAMARTLDASSSIPGTYDRYQVSKRLRFSIHTLTLAK